MRVADRWRYSANMPFYRSVGVSRPSVIRNFGKPMALVRQELMGEEGFSSDSSLLYHRGIPSATSDARVWDLPDRSSTPHHPLRPLHRSCTSCSSTRTRRNRSRSGPPARAGQRRRPDLYVIGSKESPLYRNAMATNASTSSPATHLRPCSGPCRSPTATTSSSAAQPCTARCRTESCRPTRSKQIRISRRQAVHLQIRGTAGTQSLP